MNDRTTDRTGGWDAPPPLGASALDAAVASLARGWDEGENPSVERVLAAQPGLADDTSAVLELILQEVVLREQHGEKPALAEYQGRFPELADAIRIQMEVDRALFSHRSGPATADHAPAPPRAVTQHAAGRQIGRYRVQSVLGKGGMGVAYRAWDPDLKRVVAVKTLRAADADDSEIARFRAESEAIARVRHPNIVQVFDVGEEDGQPFFAMEFCAGGSLAGKLNGSPLPPDEAAGVVEQIARGVEAAHRQNIVHRDLKPANVLLAHEPAAASSAGSSTAVNAGTATSAASGSAATGRPGEPPVGPVVCKVTDFGLAKALDADDGHTRTGAVLGTPSYMAPEQAFGNAAKVGPAADVYALGAILYECLTGRPPFRGATVPDTLEQVRHREPVGVRQLQPKVPADLETISLKCLQKEPQKRYASAADVADDLRRYLEGRPILARPVGVAERAWRWCRRNKLVASLIAGVFLTFCFGLAGTTVMWVKAVERGNQAQKNLAEAEANLRETFQAVNKSFVVISRDRLFQQPHLLELRTQLLAESRPYFESFVAKRRGDPAWKRELAKVSAHLAGLSQLTDPPDAAREKWRDAIRLHEELVRENPDSADDRFELAMALVALGFQEYADDRRLEAERDLAAALDLIRTIPDPQSRGYHLPSSHALCLAYLANVARMRGDADGSRALHEEAVRVQERAARTFPSPLAQLDLGSVRFVRGKTLTEAGDFDAAVPELAAAGTIFEQLSNTPCREQPLARANLASTASTLGVAQTHLKSVPPAEALALGEKSLLRARGMWEALSAQNPTVLNYSVRLAQTNFHLAEAYKAAKRGDDAEKAARLCAGLREKLHQAHAAETGLLVDLYDAYVLLTTIEYDRYQATDDGEEADRRFQAVLAWSGKAVDLLIRHHQKPTFPVELRAEIPRHAAERARMFGSQNRTAEAEKEWERAIQFAAPGQREQFEKERREARVRKPG